MKPDALNLASNPSRMFHSRPKEKLQEIMLTVFEKTCFEARGGITPACFEFYRGGVAVPCSSVMFQSRSSS